MPEEKKDAQQGRIDPIDEGWWLSVMGDEAEGDGFENDAQVDGDLDLNMSQVDWGYVKELYESDSIIALNVYGYNRGGLLVEGDRIQGFVPVSHLNEMPTENEESIRYESLLSYMGKELKLKVIECTPAQKRIVFSERAANAGEGKRKDLFATLEPGNIVTGHVTNVTNFGVFVDLGGVEGLIHISELSWGRVQQAADFVDIGEEVKVQVLQINEQNGRIALSMKRLIKNPWINIAQKYHIGDHTTAVITSVTHFGAFARLPEGIEGLIHISSISQNHENKRLNRIFSPGDTVTVKILHIDTDRHRLGLGLVKME
ncbi:MAG: 30S ribosomal protein S1 [Anaerolineaceae bacterium]|nr:30S ribosomal protein S1 [Anaerolineaceae bacterium]